MLAESLARYIHVTGACAPIYQATCCHIYKDTAWHDSKQKLSKPMPQTALSHGMCLLTACNAQCVHGEIDSVTWVCSNVMSCRQATCGMHHLSLYLLLLLYQEQSNMFICARACTYAKDPSPIELTRTCYGVLATAVCAVSSYQGSHTQPGGSTTSII